MSATKTFYVSRTEDLTTHTAGAATLNRADKPQLVKVFDDESDIVLSTLATDEIVGTKNTDYSAVSVVDRVAVDNMNPVTSNAVAEAKSYSTTETLTGGTWIDGKPIYRMAGYLELVTPLKNNNSVTSPISSDLDIPINYSVIGHHVGAASWIWRTGSGYSADDAIGCYIDTVNHNVVFNVPGSTQGYDKFAWSIEYTKTTD